MFGGETVPSCTLLRTSSQVPGLSKGVLSEGRAEAGTPMLSGTFGDRAGLIGRAKVCLGLLGLDWVWFGDGILHGILRRSVA